MTKLTPSGSTNETIAKQCTELAALITRHTSGKGDGLHPTAITSRRGYANDRLEFTRESAVATSLHSVVEPMLALA